MLTYKRTLLSILFLTVIFFLFLRFLHLNADFPFGITWSGVLFTDEGWYANAALKDYISGNWYIPGDFNPVIAMPIGQVLHRFFFSIFGLGVSTVRITSVVFFIFLVITTGLLVRLYFDDFTALLTTLLLVTNYEVFAYSRLAIMELIGSSFVISAFFVIGINNKTKTKLANILIATILIGTGVLTKSTMVFAVPLLGYLAWHQGKFRRRSLAYLITSIILSISIIGTYQFFVKTFFPEDISYFTQLNFLSRTHESFLKWILGIPEAILGAISLGSGFIIFSVLTTTATLVISDRYRRCPLIRLSIGYIILYTVELSGITYHPPRYYLPLIMPFTVLLATSCTELLKWYNNHKLNIFSKVSAFPLIITFGIAFFGSCEIVSYLSSPKYSFQRMAQEVGSIIKEREGSMSNIILLGNIADSASIEIGTFSINSTMGTRSIDWKIKKYHPQYLLLHKDYIYVSKSVKSNGGQTKELASWNVYSNYYKNDKQVKLMSVSW